MQQGLMAPKRDSSYKEAAKRGNKKKPAPKSNYKLVNESTKLYSSSGNLVEYPINRKVDSRDKRLMRGKKVNSEEDTPPKRQRK